MLDTIKNLLKVKSIVTILSTIVFLIIVVQGKDIPQSFQLIYSTIIAFYFGTQTVKRDLLEEDTDEKQIQKISGTNS